jgi:hypothetical protein
MPFVFDHQPEKVARLEVGKVPKRSTVLMVRSARSEPWRQATILRDAIKDDRSSG